MGVLSPYRITGNDKNVVTTHEFEYRKGLLHPTLQRYRFTAASTTLDVQFGPTVSWTLRGQLNGDYSSTNESMPLGEAMWQEPGFLRFGITHVLYDRATFPTVERSKLVDFAGIFDSASMGLGLDVFASAPVRTEPLRTYTPSEIAPTAQGSHVPLEMAMLRQSEPERWLKLQRDLVSFGRASGLFDSIDVRTLGKMDGDPFQIEVSTGGAKFNLVDVGYGISQILPILYHLFTDRSTRLSLLQQPEVHLHPRAQAELGSLLARLSAEQDSKFFVVETHSDYVLDRVRIEVQRGVIDASKVAILFFEKGKNATSIYQMRINKVGDLMQAPPQYRRFFIDEQIAMLGE